jgi:hypothetical protein
MKIRLITESDMTPDRVQWTSASESLYESTENRLITRLAT